MILKKKLVLKYEVNKLTRNKFLCIIFSILLTFSIILYISSSQAVNENKVKYNDIDKFKANITDSVDKSIQEIQVVNYTPLCFGDCYFYFYSDLKKDDLKILGGVKYYDENRTKELSGKNATYEVWNENYNYAIPQNQEICDVNQGNSTFLCRYIENGTITKFGRWEIYDITTLEKAKKVYMRIKVDVNAGETVDLVPIVQGIELSEYLDFTGATKMEYSENIYDINANVNPASGWRGEAFRIGTTGTNDNSTLVGVQLNITRTSGLPQNLTLVIRSANESGYPSTTNLSIGSINVSNEIDTLNIFKLVNISMSPMTLNASMNYTLLAFNTGNIGVIAIGANTTNPYSGGSAYAGLNAGESGAGDDHWNPQLQGTTPIDWWFQIWANITAANSCTYSSGNFAVNCQDNCSISTNVNINANSNITISGSGYFRISANITGYDNIDIRGVSSSAQCIVDIRNGGGFR